MSGERVPQQRRTRLAALEFLSRAIEAFSIPVREAERWVLPADVLWFAEEAEKHIRAFSEFFDEYLAKHPSALRRGDDPENENVVEQELAYVRKSLGFIARIGKTVTEAGTGKSTTAVVAPESTANFSAEAEELRKLRSGELKKPTPPSDSKRPQP